MSLNEDNLRLSERILRSSGFLREQTLLDKLIIFISFSCVIIFDVLILMNCFYVDGTIENVVALSEGAGSYAQMTVKLVTLIIYHKDLSEIMLVANRRFWKYDRFGNELCDRLKSYLRILDILIKVLAYFTATTVVMIILKPLLLHKLCYECWLPVGDIWFWVVIVLQIETMVYCSVIVLGFDAMFATLFMETTLQFKLLNVAFTRMRNAEDVQKCVKHQCFLFEFVEKLKKMYSIFFLVEYFDTIIVVCMQFLIIMDSEQDLSLKVKGAFYIMCLLLQQSFSCFPISLLRDESEESTNAIYNCQWREENEGFRKSLLLMIVRAQRRISVRAGGLFEMDRTAYINVCRSIGSIYTLLNTLQQ